MRQRCANELLLHGLLFIFIGTKIYIMYSRSVIKLHIYYKIPSSEGNVNTTCAVFFCLDMVPYKLGMPVCC